MHSVSQIFISQQGILKAICPACKILESEGLYSEKVKVHLFSAFSFLNFYILC